MPLGESKFVLCALHKIVRTFLTSSMMELRNFNFFRKDNPLFFSCSVAKMLSYEGDNPPKIICMEE